MVMVDNLASNTSVNKTPEEGERMSLLAKMKAKAINLSPEETREILTPFAFKIDQSLFGISLALPWRRGMALLIDLFFVGLLSGTPGELLALLVAITLFRLGSKKRAAKFGKKPGLRKGFLRVLGAFIVFVVLAETLPEMFSKVDEFNKNVEQAETNQTQVRNKANSDKEDEGISNSSGMGKGALTIASALAISQSNCADNDCWLTLSSDLLTGYTELEPTAEESSGFIEYLALKTSEQAEFTPEQKLAFINVLVEVAETAMADIKSRNMLDNMPASINTDTRDDNATLDTNNQENSKNDSSPVYKGFAWLKGLIEDLGIGFGWAAFYFTMFTAIWHGQTPGKKLLRIRVIQLDGTPLSVWDSFGRYGGYGAGIATGLLGFAQIYWDPNRQAIHDKISATIVINDTHVAREQLHEPDKSRKA